MLTLPQRSMLQEHLQEKCVACASPLCASASSVLRAWASDEVARAHIYPEPSFNAFATNIDQIKANLESYVQSALQSVAENEELVRAGCGPPLAARLLC